MTLLAVLAALVQPAVPATAQDLAALDLVASDRVAAFAGQKGDAADARARQLGLIAQRLGRTRSARPNGRNAHASSVAVRFVGAGDGAVFDTGKHIAPEKDRRTDRVATWFAGDLTVDGARHEDARASTLHTDGMLVGTDLRLGQNFLVGNAVGFGFGRAPVGENGSLGARYLSDTVYGSLFTAPDTYLDLALGAAVMNFSTAYDDAAGRSMARRGSKQVFASARYSRSFQRGRLSVTPYGQSRLSWSAFDRSSEAAAYGVERSARQAYRASLTAGLSSEGSFNRHAGQLRPHANAEMRWSRAGATAGALDIAADDVAHSYAMAATGETTAELNFAAGLDWSMSEAAKLATTYMLSADLLQDADRTQTLATRFSLKF